MVAHVCAAGAAYVGFVLFERSPRAVGVDALAPLAVAAAPGVVKVALTVDPDDALVDAVAAAPIDMIQLHGKEPPGRVAAIRARTGLPVMKVIGVREAGDLDAVAGYAPVCDQIMIDAKAPKGADRPGGHGAPFDWTLLEGRRWPVPWMLAGGLHAGNVAEAVRRTHARQIDLSSGVESAPGVKDAAMVDAFFEAVRQIGA